MSQSESEPIDVLSRITNCWVVHLPNRNHPGVVIQGDSLRVLYDLAGELLEGVGANEELRYVAQDLSDQLRGYLTLYEDAVRSHGLSLPYSRPVS